MGLGIHTWSYAWVSTFGVSTGLCIMVGPAPPLYMGKDGHSPPSGTPSRGASAFMLAQYKQRAKKRDIHGAFPCYLQDTKMCAASLLEKAKTEKPPKGLQENG